MKHYFSRSIHHCCQKQSWYPRDIEAVIQLKFMETFPQGTHQKFRHLQSYDRELRLKPSFLQRTRKHSHKPRLNFTEMLMSRTGEA